MVASLKSISVIIPVLNQKQQIKFCLDAVLAQKYPRNLLQIIVVDNGSTDGTWELLTAYEVDKTQINTIRSPYACRNKGVEMATNEILVFADSRLVPVDQNWLANGIKSLLLSNNRLVMGRLLQNPNKVYSISEWCESIDMLRFNYYAYQGVSALFTNLFIRKHDFKCVGYFDIMRSGSDAIWLQKALNNDLSIHLEVNAHGYYIFKTNKALIKKYCRTGIYQFYRQKAKKGGRFLYYAKTIIELRPPSPIFIYKILTFNSLQHKMTLKLFFNIWLNLWKLRGLKVISKLGFSIYPPD